MDAGIYARISLDGDGLGLGVARQEEDCRALAAKLNWDVVDVYVDNDVSATRSKVRPAYQAMLADARSGRIQGILIYSVDRLTRTPRELEDIVDLAASTGLRLANVRGDIDLATSQGRGMARMLGTFARMETEAMSARLKRKFAEKAASGEPHGYAPYGFVRRIPTDENGTPTGTVGLDFAVPQQAAVVREAASRVLARESLRAVVADFNERGIPAPQTERWNSTTLKQLLLRPANAGLRQHRGVVVGESRSEAILTKEVHYQLVALLTDPSRRSNHDGPGFKYLLTGIARCGLCGGTMRRLEGRLQKGKSGGTKRQPPAYSCSECFKVRRNQDKTEETVVATVVARLSKPDAASLFDTGDPGEALAALSELDALDARLATAADSFADGDIDGPQLKRITAGIRDQKVGAEKRLVRARPSTPLLALAGAADVRAAWDALPLDAQREVVDTLMVVTIVPVGSGRRFTPESIQIEWKE